MVPMIDSKHMIKFLNNRFLKIYFPGNNGNTGSMIIMKIFILLQITKNLFKAFSI